MFVLRNSAFAAASAMGAPEPIAIVPESGSITSPCPESIYIFSLLPTRSIASSRRNALSIRQSLASSTAALVRLPEEASSLVSNLSKRVKASAV